MRERLQSVLTVAVMVVGFALATVGADLAPTDTISLALVLGGIGAAYGALLVLYWVLGGELMPNIQPYDERTKRIERYATRNSWFAFIAALAAGMLGQDYMPAWYAGDFLLGTILILGLAVFFASWSWFSRRM